MAYEKRCAGPAGYSAAIRAKQFGLPVLLVERGELGGTCLNRGCIPSKALIHCANLWQKIQKADKFGITVSKAAFNWQGMQQWAKRVVTTLRRGLQSLLRHHGVEVVVGEGRLIAPDAVEVTPLTGKPFTAQAKAFVLATGSSPLLLPHDPKVPFFTEEQALFWEALPEKAVIVGGGASGVELAWLFNALGVSVTLVEMLPRLLPSIDAEISDGLRRALERQGVAVRTGTEVEKIEHRDGKAIVHCGSGEALEADAVVGAVGRRANSAGFDALGIQLNDDGTVVVNEWQQTKVPSVFAVGDLVHGGGTAHGGMDEGVKAAKAIAHRLSTGQLPPTEPPSVIPFCVYSEPQVLRVGLTEEEARQKGFEVKVSRFSWRACGAAVASDETEGSVKLVADVKTNRVVGVHILGGDAVNLSGEAIFIVGKGFSIDQAATLVRQHPSLSEGMGEALWSLLGLPLHTASAPNGGNRNEKSHEEAHPGRR